MSVNSNKSTSTNISPLVLHKFEHSYLQQLFADVEGQAIQNLSYPLQSNSDLECPFFAVSHFVSLFRGELTLEEAEELITHIKECVACSTVYSEIYKIWKYTDRTTRVEQLNYLRNCLDGLSTIQSEIRRKFIKRRLSRLERKLRKEFQVQIQTLQARVQQLLAEKGVSNEK